MGGQGWVQNVGVVTVWGQGRSEICSPHAPARRTSTHHRNVQAVDCSSTSGPGRTLLPPHDTAPPACPAPRCHSPPAHSPIPSAQQCILPTGVPSPALGAGQADRPGYQGSGARSGSSQKELLGSESATVLPQPHCIPRGSRMCCMYHGPGCPIHSWARRDQGSYQGPDKIPW